MADSIVTEAVGGRAEQSVAPRRWAVPLELLLLTALFGLAYSQFPLYHSAQNQYFFYGLMRGGFGLLQHDWLASTPDPWPVFTWLVYLTYRYLVPQAFYAYFVLLLGVYLYGLVAIASSLFPIKASRARYVAYLALVVAVHSPAVVALSARLVDLNVSRALFQGVASQRILWDMFQPGAFGVFLLLSLYLFLRGRPVATAAAVVTAVAFNPAYLLTAGILTGAYMVVLARRDQRMRTALGLGAWTLALVLPVVAYMVVVFRPTTSGLWAQAEDILVHYRLSRHAVPAAWFDTAVYVQAAVVLAALYAVRRTALFGVMALSAAAAVGLTILQVVSGNTTLALLYPWRLSVVLVPLSTALVIASVVSGFGKGPAFDRAWRGRAVVLLSLLVLVVLAGAGAVITAQRFSPRAGPEIALMNFVKETKSAQSVYMIPLAVGGRDQFGYAKVTPQWQHFRLRTGAPVFFDYWFITYNDVAVIEWYRRVRVVDTFYAGSRTLRCSTAEEWRAAYRITHVILKSDDPEACGSWKLLMGDRHYRLYQIAP